MQSITIASTDSWRHMNQKSATWITSDHFTNSLIWSQNSHRELSKQSSYSFPTYGVVGGSLRADHALIAHYRRYEVRLKCVTNKKQILDILVSRLFHIVKILNDFQFAIRLRTINHAKLLRYEIQLLAALTIHSSGYSTMLKISNFTWMYGSGQGGRKMTRELLMHPTSWKVLLHENIRIERIMITSGQ